jgi:putative endonuclease
MAKHLETGKKGEMLARLYLEEQGYTTVEQNWRFSRAEIDLIMRSDDQQLVFVEVKTRSSKAFGNPEQFISPKKVRLLNDAARAYMQSIRYEWAYRFDVISVLLPHKHPPLITHLPDAIAPSW